MASKAMASESAVRPHLAKGTSEVGDLRLDVDDSFERVEKRLPADGYPRIDSVDAVTVSQAGTDVDLALVGDGFGTVAGDISATLGGLALTVQVAPATTTVTLRLASGATLTIGDTVMLHMTVDGVAALPVPLEVVA